MRAVCRRGSGAFDRPVEQTVRPVGGMPMGRYRAEVCLRGIRVIRLVCRRWGPGLSVVSGSWIGLVPC